jgi:hypothetical protein
MRSRRAFQGLPLAGTATVGVIVGHWFSYLLAIRETRLREQILSTSGHGYWLGAVKVAIVAALVALGSVAVRHLTGRDRSDATPVGERLSGLTTRLAVLQLIGFTAMEVTERIAFGAPVGAMFLHHLYLLGLAVQILVAAAGALVLLWFARAAERVRSAVLAGRRRIGTPAVRFAATPSFVRPPLLLVGAAGLRGPPAPSIA